MTCGTLLSSLNIVSTSTKYTLNERAYFLCLFISLMLALVTIFKSYDFKTLFFTFF